MLGLLKKKVIASKEAIVADYWTKHNVTNHYQFKNAEESLDYFHWRNDQYRGYIELMQVHGQDGKTVLDYGCGPGHDLVGFGVYSKPKKLIGMDVSTSSLALSEFRLKLHHIKCDLIKIDPNNNQLNLEDSSVDYIHSSGVLHHVSNIDVIFKEFRRIICLDGEIRIMAYNYNSIWLHYIAAYQKMILDKKFVGDIREAFAKTTDGPNCPISNVYKPEEFIELTERYGFNTTYLGAAISLYETDCFNGRFKAIYDRKFRKESRDFLLNLEIDKHGYPIYDGTYAGVDGCYCLKPI